jgi:hypothetical protein
MESSTVVAFRALVMLACLIVVPLAAIFGSQFPDVVKSVLVDRIWAVVGKPPAAEQPAHADASSLATSSAPGWRSDAPPATNLGSLQATPPGRTLTAPPAVEPASALGTGDGQVRHAVVEMPGGAPSGVQRIDGNTLAGNFPASVSPVGGNPAANPAGANPGAAGQSLSQTDRFTWMEHRLREYGATYYLLETWVNGGERYRFFCQMALANSPGHTRNFEATDTDPLRAMGRVVEQVEAWRGGRQP